MPSIADLLTAMPESMYPRIMTGDDRYQYMPAEGRYAMLLQMPGNGHWCGYTLVPNRESIIELEGRRLSDWPWPLNFVPRVSYSGAGSRQISWRWYNSSQQLKTHAVLNHDGEWWVGFDTMDHPIYVFDHIREYLIHFEHIIHDYTSAAR